MNFCKGCNMKHLSLAFVLFLSLGIISGCSSTPDPEAETAEELYNQAYKKLEETSYKKAAEDFERVELEHPYSKWAVKAKLMGAYSFYKAKDYDSAIIALDRFIKFHPGNQDIAYAYYLKALCYYDQIKPVSKDQGNTEQALISLQQVVMRFPDSEYAKDAALKIVLAQDHLAGHEMEVGRYYLSQDNYLSALNRFSTVVNNYQTTSQIEEALYRQVEIYTIIGLPEEAATAGRVLAYNYPKSPWTAKANQILKTESTKDNADHPVD